VDVWRDKENQREDIGVADLLAIHETCKRRQRGSAHVVALELLTTYNIASLSGAFMGGTYFCVKSPSSLCPVHIRFDFGNMESWVL
jgi:hypothetical protein